MISINFNNFENPNKLTLIEGFKNFIKKRNLLGLKLISLYKKLLAENFFP
jgi:hypothetical protein